MATLASEEAHSSVTSLFEAIKEGNLNKFSQLYNSRSSSDPWPSHEQYEFLCASLEHKQRDISIFLLKRHCPVNNSNYESNTPLHYAVRNEDVEMIRLLASRHASIKTQTDDHDSPLQLAIKQENISVVEVIFKNFVSVEYFDKKRLLDVCTEKGYVDVVKFFLEKGASVSMKALYYAAMNGDVEIATLLLNKGASVDYGGYMDTPLTKAIESRKTDMIDLLLKHGASVNRIFDSCKPPLHAAVEKKNWVEKHCLKLISKGADVNATDADENTALHIALQSGCYDAVSFLLKHEAKVNVENHDKKTPLHYAVEKGFSGIPSLLCRGALSSGDCEGYTPLHIAVQTKNISALKCLLDHGAQVNSQTYRNKSALHFAIESENLSITKMLIEYKANVNVTDDSGSSPLHWAIKKKNVTLVEYLLQCGAHVNVRISSNDSYSSMFLYSQMLFTPLTLAVHIGDEQIIQKLLDYKADINAVDKYGHTALYAAVNEVKLSIVERILSNKPSLESKTNRDALTKAIICTNNEDNMKIINMLTTYGFVLNPEEADIYKVLNCSLKKGLGHVIEKLLCSGSGNIGIQEIHTTVLFAAVKNSTDNDLLDFLIKYGVNCDVIDNNLKSPIDYAVLNNNIEAVEQLLKKKVNIVDKADILNTAIQQEFNEIVTLLIDYYGDDIHKLGTCESPMYHAVDVCNTRAVELLLQRNVSVDKNDPAPLSLAIKKNCNAIVKLLLEHGANINGQGSLLLPSPIQCAVDVSNVEAVGLLLERNVIIKNEHELLLTALRKHSAASLNLLLAHGLNISVQDNLQRTVFYYAVIEANTKAVQVLLEKNASFVDEPDVLHIAISKCYNDIVKLLVKYGANINSLDSSQKSTINCAVNASNEEAVILLVGKKIPLQNELDLLHFAVRAKNEGIVNTLLNGGVDINLVNSEGLTPLHESVKSFQTKMTQLLLSKGANMLARTRYGETCFHLAARGPLAFLRLLFKDADINEVDSHGNTVLHIVAAIRYRHLTIEWLFKNHDNYGDIINMKNLNGDTPLLIAARLGNATNVEILLTYGANHECKDKDGNTAMCLAACTTPRTMEFFLLFSPSIEETIDEKTTFLDLLNNQGNSRIYNSGVKICVFSSFWRRKHANMAIPKKVSSILTKNSRHSSPSIWDIELLRMKTTYIKDSNITLYSLLHKDVNQLAAIFENVAIAPLMSPALFSKYKQEFKAYGQMISGRLMYGKARKALLHDINRHSYALFPRLPYYCAQNIFNNLRNEDIRSLLSLV